RNGRVETVETPSGRIALLNGGMRESYLGFPAPAHAGPQHPVPRRATLVAHIASRTGRFVRDMGEVLDAGQARVDAVTAHQARVRN
ncbi:MAG TPA: hypothetical protein VNI01_07010, partial [Elusimicrobiota bacterium]|nr:hypothetical protein [Elusimicrobiota bacterium]